MAEGSEALLHSVQLSIVAWRGVRIIQVQYMCSIHGRKHLYIYLTFRKSEGHGSN